MRERKESGNDQLLVGVTAGVTLLLLVFMLANAGWKAVGGEAKNTPEVSNLSSQETDVQNLWGLLMKEMPHCQLTEVAPLLSSPENRLTTLYAASKYNCAQIASDILLQGVNLDEKRFINGQVMDVEEFAAAHQAFDVLKIIQDERARREEEITKLAKQMESEKVTKKQKVENNEKKKFQDLQHAMAEQAELRKSIYYERARIDCEVMRERLGYAAHLMDMTECLRQGIALRRKERKELGHDVPK